MPAHTPLRVWIAGCSSGEEAYSVAIAIQEQIEALKWIVRSRSMPRISMKRPSRPPARGSIRRASARMSPRSGCSDFSTSEDGVPDQENHPRPGGVLHPERDLRSAFLQNRPALLPERPDLPGARAAKPAFSPVPLGARPGWGPVSGQFGEHRRVQHAVQRPGSQI